MSAALTCRDFIDFIGDYYEQQLDSARLGEFEKHLRLCPSCESYLQSYQQTVLWGKESCQDSDALPEDVPEELIQAILAARRAAGEEPPSAPESGP
jgi:predicted anti-sigma-YlaC factor YlaD